MVVIPWRAQSSRLQAFAFTRAWYVDHGFHVLTVDTGHEPFNLAACRNRGVAIAQSPVVVLSDADTVPQIGVLDEAIAAAATSGMTHLPYSVGEYRMLGDRGSAHALAGMDLEQCDYHAFDFSCSGVYVTTAAAWASHCGQDELFEGWAPEDFAWRITHEALLGPIPRHAGSVFALTHDSPPKDTPSATRLERYWAANGDKQTILELASEYLVRSTDGAH